MASHTASVVGSTGLIGSNILLALASNPSFSTVHALTRKSIPSYDKVQPLIEADNSKWAGLLSSVTPTPAVFYSALGTTRGQAGSFEKQRQIDYDLNLELAKKAHEAGTKVYILISSAGTSKDSMFPYGKMKAELEEAVAKIGFEHTVILRPGLLLGPRQDSRPLEFFFQNVAKGLSKVTTKATDFWAQDANTIGKAAVVAGRMCLEGKKEKGVWRVEQAEIVKLGRGGA